MLIQGTVIIVVIAFAFGLIGFFKPKASIFAMPKWFGLQLTIAASIFLAFYPSAWDFKLQGVGQAIKDIVFWLLLPNVVSYCVAFYFGQWLICRGWRPWRRRRKPRF